MRRILVLSALSFDIRRFHDAVLGGGAMPLTLLERRIDQWIAAEKQPG